MQCWQNLQQIIEQSIMKSAKIQKSILVYQSVRKKNLFNVLVIKCYAGKTFSSTVKVIVSLFRRQNIWQCTDYKTFRISCPMPCWMFCPPNIKNNVFLMISLMLSWKVCHRNTKSNIFKMLCLLLCWMCLRQGIENNALLNALLKFP